MRLVAALLFLMAILAAVIAPISCSKPHNYVFAPNGGGGGIVLTGSPDSMQVWVRGYGDYSSVPRLITWPNGAFNALVAFHAYQPIPLPPFYWQRYEKSTYVALSYFGRFTGAIINGQRLTTSSFQAYPEGITDSLGAMTSTFDVTYNDSDSTFTGTATATASNASMLGSPIPIKLYLEGTQPSGIPPPQP
jgi:hypothetical protein